jgi:Ca2+-binding EF-hand superfamily protein
MLANGVTMTRLPLAAALFGLATVAGAQTPPPSPPAAGTSFDTWSVRARERLMALDTDHDGKISKEEFAARGGMAAHGADASGDKPDAPKHDGSRMFSHMDANSDGYLDVSEVNALLARRFARMDANHDRVLTADERQAMRGMHAPEQ